MKALLAPLVLGSTLVFGCSGAALENATAPHAPSAASMPAVQAGHEGHARTYGKPTPAELAKLTPLQLRVTQEAATEPPFQNQYWDNHAAGIYVDVATGEPLFSSQDKFESGTGWPSFTRPIEAERVVDAEDLTHGMVRTEVTSKGGGSHLGHVFTDGPAPTGLRYCMNSSSLRFVPFASLEEEGYGAYRAPFLASNHGAPPPAATVNACNFPAPGQKAGCSATIAVAIVGGRCVARTRDAIGKAPGVIDTTLGTDGADKALALRVLFDPTKTTYDALVRAWIAEGGAHAADGRVLATTSDEERIAKRTLDESHASAAVVRTSGFRDATPDDVKNTVGDAAGRMATNRCL